MLLKKAQKCFRSSGLGEGAGPPFLPMDRSRFQINWEQVGYILGGGHVFFGDKDPGDGSHSGKP